MAGIYLRGKTWWVRYRVGGQNIQKSLGTSNKREAEALKKKYEAAKVSNLLQTESRTPIRDVLDSLAIHWRMNRPHKSAENDLSRLRRIFGVDACQSLAYPNRTASKFMENTPTPLKRLDRRSGTYLIARTLEEVSSQAISEFLTQYQQEHSVCAKTLNRYRAVLGSLFTFAEQYKGYICPERGVKSPIGLVKPIKEAAKPIQYLRHEEISTQLEALADQPEIRALVAVYIYAGLRRGEALWLTNEDVDLTSRVIRVKNKAINSEQWHTKTGKDRIVPISTALASELAAYQSIRRPSIWYFPSPWGERWNPDNFSAHLREINKSKGLAWSCLLYRHTFGSLLAQKGVSLYQISAMMGNSPEICRKHYAALVPSEMHDHVEF